MESPHILLSRQLETALMTNAAYLWSRTRLLSEFKQVLRAVALWQGVVIQSNHGGLQFLAGNNLVGHLRWDGRLDVLVPAELRDRLIAEEMAASHPDPSRWDRVVWIVRTPADVERAVWLLRLSYLRCQPDRPARILSESNHLENSLERPIP